MTKAPVLKLVTRAAQPPPAVRVADWSILMARAQDGDRLAYRQLLECITPYLRALAARRHGNPSDIEDAVQDILLTVHAMRATYDPARPFGPWLTAIASRRLIDRLRRIGRRRRHETELEPMHEAIGDAAAVPAHDTGATDIAAAIGQLSASQQTAVQLMKIEGLSLKEASAASGLSVAALKTASHRAVRRLREFLSGGSAT